MYESLSALLLSDVKSAHTLCDACFSHIMEWLVVHTWRAGMQENTSSFNHIQTPELLETMQALVEHDEIDGALRQPRFEVKDVLPDLLQSSQKMIRAASWPWRSTLMTFCLSGGPGDPAGI